MQIRISKDDGTPIYQQVVRQIKLLVSSGRLAEGEQLPPVRKLAQLLVINPNTVARAYRELETASVVESRRGAGVFVSGAASPLSRKEKNRRLNERIDHLLAEADQMDFPIECVGDLVNQRAKTFRSKRTGSS